MQRVPALFKANNPNLEDDGKEHRSIFSKQRLDNPRLQEFPGNAGQVRRVEFG
jgi:hypothetical protein